MRCDFLLRDHDRMGERMEGFRWVLGHFGGVLGCNTYEAFTVPRLTVGVCNAPRPMCQVSSSYSLWLPCHFRACNAFHIMSSCASHFHMCSSHASEHFPRCPFCDPALLCPPASPFASFRVRVLNVLGLDRDLPSSLGLPPVDRLSSFVPFGVRLILQRLTGEL